MIRAHPLYLPTLVLILLGGFTKSAQFPFHFWLPHAMAAPTPVSAYLHSATMVKAGVFLLVRLWPALGGTNEWLWLVGSVGLLTFILGAFIAIFQQDLKGLLAYSTISHLGLITLLIGLDTPLGQVAAIFHIMNHATFKASLFMAAGIIDHETGTRDIRRLSGLWRFMPITAALAMVAAAAMAGVPLLNGFLSKEMFFAETIEVHDNSIVDQALPYIVTAASMFTVAYSLRFIRDVFFGPAPTELPRTPSEPPFLMRFPAELLVLACLLVGIVPAVTVGPLLETAVHAVVGPNIPEYSLAVWHGFTPELLMSLVALCGGIGLYFMLRSYLLTCDGPPLLRHIKGQRIFERVLVTLSWRVARRLERLLGTDRLQPQLQLLVCAALLVGAVPLFARGIRTEGSMPAGFDFVFGMIWAVGIACALAAAYQAKFHRLAALILLGGTGLVTCVSFVWLSAPDLALTQLVVETVTTVLLLLGLRWLPKRVHKFGPDGTTASLIRWYRVRDFAMAVAAGSGLAALAYVIMTRPQPESIAGFFVENAYTRGGGTNIVNVILVDFRAFDTFGEITVLCIVAITVYALLRRFRPAAESIPIPEQQRAQDSYDEAHPDRLKGDTIKSAMAIPALMMAMLFPVIGAVAVFLLLRGHDLPGGGFVAGDHDGRGIHSPVHGSRDSMGGSAAARLARTMDGHRAAPRRQRRGRRVAVRSALPELVLLLCRHSIDRSRSAGECAPVRPWRVRVGRRCDRPDADRDRASVRAQSPGAEQQRACRACGLSKGRGAIVEVILALGIGVLAGSGVWLILRPRTFQVIIGLSLLSYAVNLFIIAMGRLRTGAAPVLAARGVGDPAHFADPLPQALVLTAIVISFATTALFLVVLLASRGLTGTDHVDGREPEQ